jgi:hypothetical protein
VHPSRGKAGTAHGADAVRSSERLELNDGNLSRIIHLGRQRDSVIHGFRINVARRQHVVWIRAIADAELINCIFNVFGIDANYANVLDAFLDPLIDKRIQSRPEPARRVQDNLARI